MYDYFFSGNQYIRVQRGDTGPGHIDPGHPGNISAWGWPAGFAPNGIDAALYSGSMCYFFKGPNFIQVHRAGNVGAGQLVGGIQPISAWGWPSGFGANGIDAALWSGPVTYFFSGSQYIRVSRKNDTDFGKTDPGYPRSISAGWNWGSFGANGIKAALPSGSKCYFFSGRTYIRVSRGIESAGRLDPGYPGDISAWNWGSFGVNGIDAALYSGGPLEPAPPQGLGSNYNYFMAAEAGGLPLTGVSVTITIDNDMVTTSGGMGFQLNTYSEEISNETQYYPNWQQYVIYIEPNALPLWAMVDNWYGTVPAGTDNQLINFEEQFANLAVNNTLQAGSSITFTLLNDSNNNVTGCRYTYTNPQGQSSTTTINLLGQNCIPTSKPIDQTQIAPIVALTVNIVGDYNSAYASLSSAEGSITYSANQPLVPLSTEPTYTAFADGTGETGNTTYGGMSVIASKRVSQIWGMTPATVAAAADPSMGRRRHGLPLPPHVKKQSDAKAMQTALEQA